MEVDFIEYNQVQTLQSHITMFIIMQLVSYHGLNRSLQVNIFFYGERNVEI